MAGKGNFPKLNLHGGCWNGENIELDGWVQQTKSDYQRVHHWLGSRENFRDSQWIHQENLGGGGG